MISLIDKLPVYYSSEHGITFEKYRKLSLKDFYRMMKKLHCNPDRDYQDLYNALLQKDAQRFKRILNKYVEIESIKMGNPVIFIKTPITVQEFSSFGYFIYYKIFAELSVKEPEI